MLTEDPSIDVASLAVLVGEEYGPSAPPRFVAVGGDSWCFEAAPWWVSVRRDRLGHVPAAYEGAVRLRESGLDFVLAPAVGRAGRVVHDLAGRPVVVFPLVAGTELRSPSKRQVESVRDMVRAIHAVDGLDDLPRETFAVAFEDELNRSLAVARAGATVAGPFGAPVSRLVRANAGLIADLRDELAVATDACRAADLDRVPTHGEPSNVLATDAGQLLLMDWGGLALGPPERDWWALVDFGLGWPAGTRPAVRRFYELTWILGEIAEYVDRFTHPHSGDAGDIDKWSELQGYLPDGS